MEVRRFRMYVLTDDLLAERLRTLVQHDEMLAFELAMGLG